MAQAVVDDQKAQKERVLAYKSPTHDIPGDYTMAPNAVPALPGGIENFDDSSNDSSTHIYMQVAYVNLLFGFTLLFVGLVTISRTP